MLTDVHVVLTPAACRLLDSIPFYRPLSLAGYMYLNVILAGVQVALTVKRMRTACMVHRDVGVQGHLQKKPQREKLTRIKLEGS